MCKSHITRRVGVSTVPVARPRTGVERAARAADALILAVGTLGDVVAGVGAR